MSHISCDKEVFFHQLTTLIVQLEQPMLCVCQSVCMYTCVRTIAFKRSGL